MKILFLNHNQERFGTYFRCYNLASAISMQGILVTLICASGHNWDFLIRKRKINENFYLITLPRFKYHKYFTGQLIRLILTIPFVLFSHYDILHAFTVAQPQIGIPALISKWIRRKKLIVDWDDLWGGGFADEHGDLIAKILSFWETYVPRYANRMTFVSDFLGEKIKILGLMNKAVKIPNGANLDKIKLTIKKEASQLLKLNSTDKYLLCLGNTYQEKGLQIMFYAFDSLSRYHDNLFLLLVGSVGIPTSLKNIYNKNRKKIIITGSVPYDKVLLYLSLADILILPMADNPIEKARFPIRLGDYLASGKPIVANAVGEVEHYLLKYNAGLICPVDSAGKMADSIETIFKNHELASKLSQNALCLVKKELNWQILGNQLTKLYTIVYNE